MLLGARGPRYRKKSWCINRSYLSTLQTVMANRRYLAAPSPLASTSTTRRREEPELFNPHPTHPVPSSEKATPRHLLCYIVTRKLRFSKWDRRYFPLARARGPRLGDTANLRGQPTPAIPQRRIRRRNRFGTLDDKEREEEKMTHAQ